MRHFLLLGAIGVVGLVGCGDDDGGSAGDVERYCQLVDELDAAGNEAFEGLDENASEEDFANASREFVEANRGRFDDVRDAAPEEIRDDISILIEAIESGDFFSEDEVDPEASQAEENVNAFEDENCGPDEDE